MNQSLKILMICDEIWNRRGKEGKKFSFPSGLEGATSEHGLLFSRCWGGIQFGIPIAMLATVSDVAFVVRIGFILWLFSTGFFMLFGGGPF